MTTLWPNGTITQPTTSSAFGPRNTTTPGASRDHKGWDSVGYSLVRAIADGTVVAVGVVRGWEAGGIQAWIQHDGFFTRSFHFKSTPAVQVGEKVKAGRILGIMGRTGVASGVHLHLEVTPGTVHYRNSGQIDPVPFIRDRINRPTPKPTPTPAPTENEVITMAAGFAYTNDTSNAKRRGVHFDTADGWTSETSWFDVAYANNIANGYGHPKAMPLTSGGFDRFVGDLKAKYARK